MRLRSHRTRGIGKCMLSLLIAVALAGCLTGTTPTFPLDQDPGAGVADTDGSPSDHPATGGTGNGGGDGDPVTDQAADPPGMISPFHAKLKHGGYWDLFWTGSTSKLSDDAEGNGVNKERNATIRWLGGIAGVDDPDTFLTRGRIRFSVKVNADGLEVGGGGKHLINLAATPLSRGVRSSRKGTRVEIANPGDRPRFVLHNYNDQGEGGARDLGNLPFQFEPDRWVDIDWSWELIGRELTMVCNGRTYRTTLLPESEGPGRYWGSGHMETQSGGGRFTFSAVRVSAD